MGHWMVYSYIIRIPPRICTHKIQLKLDYIAKIENKCRLNPPIQKAVNKNITKQLDAGVVYPIADNKWVRRIQCVLKMGGIIVVLNEKMSLVI